MLLSREVSGACCDNTNVACLVIGSATDTTTYNDTNPQYVAYLDGFNTNPKNSLYFVRTCSGSDVCDCATGSGGLMSYYQVLTDCARLTWDSAGTLNTTTIKQVTTGSSFVIYATPPSNTTALGNQTCTVNVGWFYGSAWNYKSFSYILVTQACYVSKIEWTTTGFSIANQVYTVLANTITITTSLATQTNPCGYTVTYELLNTTGLTAADSTVFSYTAGSPGTISIYTANNAKVWATPY